VRIVVYPHSMELGGSQLIAVDLAAVMRDRGHEVVVFSPPGELVRVVAERGLRHEVAPRPRFRPSPAVMNRLSAVVEEFGADVVHGFEWPPALEAVFGPERRLGVPAVCTVMSMAVAPFLPPWLPLTVGTRQLLRTVTARHPASMLLEPTVDTAANRPVDQDDAKRRLGIAPGTLVVSLVTRLVPELKLEGVLSAITVVGELAGALPVTLVITGDGPARAQVEAAAERVNSGRATPAVRVTGALADPRCVYDAADITLGMGGSALKAMAFEKPLVVQGEHGYWRLLTPETLPEFLEQGWFGIGDSGPEAGRTTLRQILHRLLTDPPRRRELGEFSRAIAESTFGLDRAADRLEGFYAESIRAAAAAGGASRFVGPYLAATRYDLTRKVKRRLGGVASDDFNSLPVLQGTTERATTS
jgi:glycosyltransferase involved in cell wall biosynthesis